MYNSPEVDRMWNDQRSSHFDEGVFMYIYICVNILLSLQDLYRKIWNRPLARQGYAETSLMFQLPKTFRFVGNIQVCLKIMAMLNREILMILSSVDGCGTNPHPTYMVSLKNNKLMTII